MAGRPRWWAAGLVLSVALVVGALVWVGQHQPSYDVHRGAGPVGAQHRSEGAGRPPEHLTGPLHVRRTADTLVLVQGGSREADRMSGLARTAVRQVRRVLPDWHGRLVVEVPATQRRLERLLRVSPGTYAGIAAVTRTADGSTSRSAPSRVYVNPRTFLPLTRREAQVVLTHETTHVATRAATSPSPSWLVEGFADYVALRAQRLPTRVTAARIGALVAAHGVPARLPSDRDLAAGAPHLEATYESAWLACRLIARTAGTQGLVGLYRAVDAGQRLDEALRSRLGFGRHALTERWRTLLAHLPA